jgi:hypothetical protein
MASVCFLYNLWPPPYLAVQLLAACAPMTSAGRGSTMSIAFSSPGIGRSLGGFDHRYCLSESDSAPRV